MCNTLFKRQSLSSEDYVEWLIITVRWLRCLPKDQNVVSCSSPTQDQTLWLRDLKNIKTSLCIRHSESLCSLYPLGLLGQNSLSSWNASRQDGLDIFAQISEGCELESQPGLWDLKNIKNSFMGPSMFMFEKEVAYAKDTHFNCKCEQILLTSVYHYHYVILTRNHFFIVYCTKMSIT